jgi:hypothetical protein
MKGDDGCGTGRETQDEALGHGGMSPIWSKPALSRQHAQGLRSAGACFKKAGAAGLLPLFGFAPRKLASGRLFTWARCTFIQQTAADNRRLIAYFMSMMPLI